jgi:hypothetical protein
VNPRPNSQPFLFTPLSAAVCWLSTTEEKEALKQEILREETAKHQAQLQALQDKYDESRDHFKYGCAVLRFQLEQQNLTCGALVQ